MVMVQFEPQANETSLADGCLIPKETPLNAQLGRGERTPCRFSMAHPVTLWPLKLTQARYYTRDLGDLRGLPLTIETKAALSLTLETTAALPLSHLKLDQLDIHLHGENELPTRIYEQLFAHNVGAYLQWTTEDGLSRWVPLPKGAVKPVGFAPEEAMLPQTPRNFEGYRFLREYFAFAQRFYFFRVIGLRQALTQAQGGKAQLVFVFRNQDMSLEGRLDEGHFRLFCTPAVNLFPQRLDPIPLSDRSPEYHAIADRTRPIDYEIYRITDVVGRGSQGGEEVHFAPLYLARDEFQRHEGFYTVRREPRMISAKERRFGKTSTYLGSEVYLSLTDTKSGAYRSNLQELGVTALCTNRHLPMSMAVGLPRGDFNLEMASPVAVARCLSKPVPPRMALPAGKWTWQLISHLSLNYFSLTDEEKERGAQALQGLLLLYADPQKAIHGKQIRSIKGIRSEPVVRRVPTPGPIAFARGLQVKLTLDEDAFEDASPAVLAAVLDQFFAKYVSLNSFTETVLKTVQRGEVLRWPAIIGKKQII
jgi:type VI secretion system protein ImpG